jgi:hypothetical protein
MRHLLPRSPLEGSLAAVSSCVGVGEPWAWARSAGRLAHAGLPQTLWCGRCSPEFLCIKWWVPLPLKPSVAPCGSRSRGEASCGPRPSSDCDGSGRSGLPGEDAEGSPDPLLVAAVLGSHGSVLLTLRAAWHRQPFVPPTNIFIHIPKR